MSRRPSWDEVWLQVAYDVSERSLCWRRQVGAVIVSADNRVQAASYNGPQPGFTHDRLDCRHWCPRSLSDDKSADYSACVASHAEASALVRADRSQLGGGTIFCTAGTCINCAKLIAHTELRRLVHVVGPQDMHRNPDDVEAFLRGTGREVVRIELSETERV